MGMLLLLMYMGSGTFQDSVELYYNVDYMKSELTPPFNNIIGFGLLFSSGILLTTIFINKYFKNE